MDIINRINELCEERGISKYRLSQLTGISQSAFSKMNRQQSSLTIENVKRICDALGISLAQFFSDDQIYPDLTEDQKNLIDFWKLLSLSKREFVLDMMKKLKDLE